MIDLTVDAEYWLDRDQLLELVSVPGIEFRLVPSVRVRSPTGVVEAQLCGFEINAEHARLFVEAVFPDNENKYHRIEVGVMPADNEDCNPIVFLM